MFILLFNFDNWELNNGGQRKTETETETERERETREERERERETGERKGEGWEEGRKKEREGARVSE